MISELETQVDYTVSICVCVNCEHNARVTELGCDVKTIAWHYWNDRERIMCVIVMSVTIGFFTREEVMISHRSTDTEYYSIHSGLHRSQRRRKKLSKHKHYWNDQTKDNERGLEINGRIYVEQSKALTIWHINVVTLAVLSWLYYLSTINVTH